MHKLPALSAVFMILLWGVSAAVGQVRWSLGAPRPYDRSQVIEAPSQRATPPLPSSPEFGVRNPPKYPADAVRQRHEGTVILLILVGPDGVPQDVRLSQTSGYAELDREAYRTVWGWTYKRSEMSSSAAEYKRVPLVFSLHMNDSASPSTPH